MDESYSTGESPAAGGELARALIARLIPTADAGLLVGALTAELAAARRESSEPAPAGVPRDANPAPGEHELRRVRTQLALGESARMVQHAMNNPLTALLAEAQLLQLEPLTNEQAQAVGRMIDSARRIAAVVRSLDDPAETWVG